DVSLLRPWRTPKPHAFSLLAALPISSRRGCRLRVADAVVLVEPGLLLGTEVPVVLGVRRVLHDVLAVGHHDVAVVEAGGRERDEAAARAEQPGRDGHPLRPPREVVDVDVVDLPDLLAVGSVELQADPVGQLLCGGHRFLLAPAVGSRGSYPGPGGTRQADARTCAGL